MESKVGDPLPPQIDITDAELDLLLDIIDDEVQQVDDCISSLINKEQHSSVDDLLASSDPVTSLKAEMKQVREKILEKRKVKQ